MGWIQNVRRWWMHYRVMRWLKGLTPEKRAELLEKLRGLGK